MMRPPPRYAPAGRDVVSIRVAGELARRITLKNTASKLAGYTRKLTCDL